MIGAAYGDSLGALPEFLNYDAILNQFGRNGVERCEPFFGLPAGSITDDTQMAMATARGLIKGVKKEYDRYFILKSIWGEYLKWLESQSRPGESRAPGSTCLSALRSGKMGNIDVPLNHSNGCGGIMRAHPVGIAFAGQIARAFDIGLRSAAITHGGSEGYMPAGFLAALVSEIFNGTDFMEAIQKNIDYMTIIFSPIRTDATVRIVARALASFNDSGETGRIIDQTFATRSNSAGWYGDEALGVALFACLRASEPVEAVKIAVNHSGDSDSTGSIAGAIAGAMYGHRAFCEELRRTNVELEHQEILLDLGGILFDIGQSGGK